MGVGQCEVCGAIAMAHINGRGMCGDANHIRQVVASTMENLRQAVEAALDYQSPHPDLVEEQGDGE